MNQKQIIDKLLRTLPWADQMRIRREGAKHRAKRPLDIEALYNQVLEEEKRKKELGRE
jgi:hypothetical protein